MSKPTWPTTTDTTREGCLYLCLARQRFSHHSSNVVVYPDVQLNTQDLYNLFPDGRLNHVGSTDHQVLCGQLLHHLQLLRCAITDVSSHSTSGILYSGAVATSATWPPPSPATSWLSVGRRGPRRRDTGRREEKGKQGCATMKSSSCCCTPLRTSSQPQTSSYHV